MVQLEIPLWNGTTPNTLILHQNVHAYAVLNDCRLESRQKKCFKPAIPIARMQYAYFLGRHNSLFPK